MDPLTIGTTIVGLGSKLLDKFFPDPEQKARAQLALLEMQQNGELKQIEVQLSAILAEAKSDDPWTSRARPSFLYVMYAMILAAIPMGFLHAVRPDVAVSIAAGMKAWLSAIPEDMWMLFGAGYLGYTGFRGLEKVKRKA